MPTDNEHLTNLEREEQKESFIIHHTQVFIDLMTSKGIAFDKTIKEHVLLNVELDDEYPAIVEQFITGDPFDAQHLMMEMLDKHILQMGIEYAEEAWGAMYD